MSLAPIPSRMLHDTAKIFVVKGMDRYQEKTYDEYTIEHVHLQNDIDTIKGPDNTEVQIRGILFVDCRRSTPCLDLYQLQCDSLKNGDTMRVQINGAGDFAVLNVDGVPDVPATRVHHYELTLT